MSKKKGITLIVIVSVLILAITLAVSYAYWSVTKKQETTNEILSGCFDMEITGERNAINLQNSYPISDSKANSLTPYTFTVRNTCDVYASYSINLEALEGSTLNTNFIAVKVNNEAKSILGSLPNATKSESSSVEARTIINGLLGEGETEEYTVRIWMDESVTLEDDAQDKTFIGKIVLVASPSNYSPVNKGITLLNEALLVNEYQLEDVNEAKARIAAKGEPDTTKPAPLIDWQEKSEGTTSVTISKPSCEEIGNFGITENSCKLFIGTGKTFNSTTGYFSLTNGAFVDPTTLDYQNNDYYVVTYAGMSAGFRWLPNDNIDSLYYVNGTKIMKISEVTVSNGTSTNNGNTIQIKKYQISGENYIPLEKENDASDKGLYAVADDYSTDTNGVVSYIYRGNVKNNYVYFADAYWQIIRINGDNSIRIMYAGTTNNATGSQRGINNTKYSFNLSNNNPAYVGYMYGNTLNENYAKTHTNEIESYVKKEVIDPWYKTNIFDKGFSSYIADSGFCNDRSVASGDGYTTSNYISWGANNRYSNGTPTLICPNPDNDLFTTNTSLIGNKKLIYPVGLITADEMMYSGMYGTFINEKTYTYNTVGYWTMSPMRSASTDTVSRNFDVKSNGYINSTWVSDKSMIRPVINLKADTTITGGTGTSSDPFIVDTSV